MFKLSPDVDKNKIFLVNLSEIEGRLDPIFYNAYTQKFIRGKYKITTIKNVAKNIKSGIGAGKQDQSDKHNGIIQIRPTNITNDGFLKFDKNIYLPISKSTDKIYENDVLFNNTNSQELVGKTAIAHNINGYFYSNHITKITTNSNIEPKYLWILLNAYQRNKIFYSICTNWNNQSGIGIELLKSLKIPLPPKETQQEIIDLYETAYEEKQQKEAEAKRLLNSIDDYMLSELGITLPKKDNSLENRISKVNFSEISGNRFDPYYYQLHFHIFFKQLSKCIYPIFTIKQIAKVITSGITPLSGSDAYTKDKKNGIPFIRSGNININGDINFNELLYIKEEIHKTIMRSSQVKYNDLLIAIVGATIGQVGIYKNNREANINQAIALVRLKGDNNVEFIKEVLNSSIGQYNLSRLKRPVARANINLEEISTIQLPIPPLEKQNEIAKHIKQIREQAKQLKAEATKILEQARQEVEKIILGE